MPVASELRLLFLYYSEGMQVNKVMGVKFGKH